jgi:arsenate reductase-like glutaredoxin family protein
MAVIFSWRSPSARKLGLDATATDDEQLLSLMLHEPRLIRRPILVAGDRVLVGAEPKGLAAALG